MKQNQEMIDLLSAISAEVEQGNVQGFSISLITTSDLLSECKVVGNITPQQAAQLIGWNHMATQLLSDFIIEDVFEAMH